MKKQLTVVSLVLLISLMGCQWLMEVQAAPTITSQVVDSQGADSTLYLDTQNNPHIFYDKQDIGDNQPKGMFYAERAGQEWNIQQVADTAGNIFIMDTEKEPHIISTTNSTFKDTPVPGSHWNFETVGFSELADNTMLLDSSGKLHAAYVNITYLDTAHENYTEFFRYSTWTNAGESTQTIEETNSTAASFHTLSPVSIALDSNGKPQIVFLELRGNETTEVAKLMYAQWTGTDWNIQAIGDIAPVLGKIGNLLLDSKDQPHLCYFYGNLLYYAYLNGNSWVNQPVESKINSAIDYQPPALILDASGNPQVFFFKESKDRVISTYLASAKIIGTEWNIEPIGNLSEVSWDHSPRISNIILDASGNPHFAYATEITTYRGVPIYADLTYVFIEVNSPLFLILIIAGITITAVGVSSFIYLAKRRKIPKRNSP